MDSSGVQYNAAVIVKLKKMYNNLRKYYELNMFRAFLMIDKHGRNNESHSVSRNTDRQPRIQESAKSQERKA